MRFQVGYFATPHKRCSQVHIVKPNGRTACGRKLKGEYQWCARWVFLSLVECTKCKEWWAKRDERM